MAFVLKQSDSYSWPVTLVIPVDGGRREKHTFDAEFKRLPQTRINEIIKQARAMERGRFSEDEMLEDQTACAEILIGWSNVVDSKGEEIPFSVKALDQLLELPTIAGQIVRAWFESLEVAKKKN
jgi:hypothetical protein|tara:strand:+ start:154 stop:525 length:372 start_codon:yes stop_codon:yes gene_type:complete